MLVLTRKQQESIRIGDKICIKIFALKGKSVRIGIEAPEEFQILRGELWDVRQEFAESPADDQWNSNESSELFFLEQ